MGLAETAELAVRISLKDNASAGIRGLQKNLGSLSGSVARAGKGVGQIGTGLARAGVVIGTSVVTGLTAAAKATIDFQDAFSGVRKTVDASEPDLAKLYASLRDLATRIPVKFTDLAAIAQEAGALGVATNDVVGFTDTVARLSAATVGLSTDAAAEAFGKLGNILFTNKEKADGLTKEYEQLGSALVALGNAGASSEGDIIEVAKRFGAAGHQAGLSAAQVLGFSSAIASLGVEPEAGGSSLSRIFNNITKYLGTGDKKIQAFAKTTGLTVKDFKKLWAKDATGAVTLFLQNLGKLDKFQASKVLNDAGVHNIRDINAILLLSQHTDELTRQVDLSTEAYKANTALADVSAKRFDTLKNKLIVLKNLFFDAAVTVGEGFTPAIGRAADKLGHFLRDPGNQASLKALGTDIGNAIDGIDWGRVLDSAKTFASVMKGAVDFALTLLSAIDKLPDSIKAAGLGFLGLNKLSGGLIGQGVGNVVGGLAGAAAKGLGSKLPGIGSLFAQPVFVTNWPLGGIGGGLGVASGGTGLLGKAVSLILPVAIGWEIGSALGTALAPYYTQLVNEVRPKVKSDKELGSVAALAKAQQEAARNLQALPDKISAKQAAKFNALRDKMEGLRIATTTRLSTVQSGIVAGAHSDRNAIVTAIHGIQRPIVNVSVHSEYTRVAYVSGGTVARYYKKVIY